MRRIDEFRHCVEEGGGGSHAAHKRRATRAEDDLLYLGDNESVLTDINKWVGEGSKATLANAPNADILSEIIEKLRERIERGSATFLVKVKSHRGDP